MPTTWFITGTSSGFGRLLTERLLARGDRVAATMPEYEKTPAGDVRRAIVNGTLELPSDPLKVAEAMIKLIDSGATPLRLPLGPDTYVDVRAALVSRLAEHDTHREVAYSVARDQPA